MNREIIPADYDGNMLAIGDYVKHDSHTWEIVDYCDADHKKYWDEDYEEHSILLLTPRSFEGENKWVEDCEVEQTDNQQLYLIDLL